MRLLGGSKGAKNGMKLQKNVGERSERVDWRGRQGPDSRSARFAHRFLLPLFSPQRSLVLGFSGTDHSVSVIFYLGWNLCVEYL